jgi:hypothetical protein
MTVSPRKKQRIVETYNTYRLQKAPEAIARTCSEFDISRSTLFKYRRQFLQNQERQVHDPAGPGSAFLTGADVDRDQRKETYRNKKDDPEWAERQVAIKRKYTLGNDTYHRTLRYCFAHIVTTAKKRDNLATDAPLLLTVEDVHRMWQDQDGICALTGLPMTFQGPPHAPCTVSLARIDPRKGMAATNRMLVCHFANKLKRNFSMMQVKEVLRAAYEFQTTGKVEHWDEIKMPPIYKVRTQLARCLGNSARRAVTRKKLLNLEEGAHNITLEHLVEQYIRQSRRCALTGMVLTPAFYSPDIALEPRSISVDRIDSNRGYTPGNVQLTGFSINLAKSNYDQEMFVDLLKRMELK